MRALPLALLLAAVSLGAQPAEDPVTLEQIRAHPDWLGRAPERAWWSADGSGIYFERKLEGSEERGLYRADVATGETLEIPLAERGAADGEDGDWSDDRRRRVYTLHGDLFVRDLAAGRVRQLTRTEAEESEPRFLAGDGAVSFVRDDEIFVRELESGLERQPAVLRFEKDPDAEPEPDYRRDQQRRLIGWVAEQERQREASRERERRARDEDPTHPPNPVYLGEDVERRAASLSPDGRWLLLVLAPESQQAGRSDSMPRFVTDDAYVDPEEVRPLVGTGKPVSDRLVLLDLESRERHEPGWDVLPGRDEDPLAELREAARERRRLQAGENDEPLGGGKDGDEKDEREGEGADQDFERAIRVGSGGLGSAVRDGIFWSDDSGRLVLQVFAADHKDRWLAEIDLASGELRPLERFSDPAWINWDHNEVGFVPGTRTLWFAAETSGWSQLYLRPEDGDSRRLSQGDFVVRDVTPSPDGRFLYYTANPEHPGVYETWRWDLEGGRAEAVTALGGRNRYRLSPDGRRLLVTHSEALLPPELHVQEARPGATPRRLTFTVSERFASRPWVAPELVEVPSTHHDRPIHARVYDAGGAGPRPAVVFVHGAGYLQNAHAGWSSYFREFMFHTLLARRGYVVLDMDYRASQGYGRDWRTAIYRRMGEPELEDLADGVRWLAAERGVDPERVGVYGGSYGGFLTLMALFQRPELFACGAALRPVTDWAHYNHPYTSRILNTPDLDPEAYERSSPLELAEGLARPLLIAHGMVDDNVFYKDSVRLAQRLIELKKADWELAAYPIEPHGFREPTSWLDEYRRILELFEAHLR
jgi:dipeptidyl aminopeptidase/acylaminoacyl peptidase